MKDISSKLRERVDDLQDDVDKLIQNQVYLRTLPLRVEQPQHQNDETLQRLQKIKIVKKKFRQRQFDTPKGLLNKMTLNNQKVTVETPKSRPKCLMRIMSAQNLEMPKVVEKIEENMIRKERYVPDHKMPLETSKSRLFRKLNPEQAGISVQNQKEFLKNE